MLTKLDIYIVFLPFALIFISSVLFLFLQLFLNKKYLSNLFISFIIVFLLNLLIIYKLSPNLNYNEIYYLIFVYLCSSCIFMNLIQIPVSALQLTILRIVYLNPGISKKEIIKKYNSDHIFEEKIRRLKSSGIIDKNKTSYFLKNRKILLILNSFLILKKIFNVKS